MTRSNNLIIYIDPWIIGIVSICIFYMIGLPDFSGEYSGFAQGALIFGVPLITMMLIDECRRRYNYRNNNIDVVELIVKSIIESTHNICDEKSDEYNESIDSEENNESTSSEENNESTSSEENNESTNSDEHNESTNSDEHNESTSSEENNESANSEENNSDEHNESTNSEENNNLNNNPFTELIVNSITQSIVESIDNEAHNICEENNNPFTELIVNSITQSIVESTLDFT